MDHLERHEAPERLPLSNFQRAILREVERRIRQCDGAEIQRVNFMLVSSRDISLGAAEPCLIDEVSQFNWPLDDEDVELAEEE